MSDIFDGYIESYATAMQSPRLFDSLILERSTPTGKTVVRMTSNSTSILGAAGLSRHWATGAIRLKYGLDASMYREVMRQFQRLATDTGDRLQWGDPELTGFLATEALHGWLLDRQFHGRDSDWRNRCVVLKKLLDREVKDAAQAIHRHL